MGYLTDAYYWPSSRFRGLTLEVVQACEDNLRRFVESRGVIRRLRRAAWPWWKIGAPPRVDHRAMYQTTAGRIFTYQPYDLTEAEAERIRLWADQAGIDAEILPPSESWHYPGRTSVVILKRR